MPDLPTEQQQVTPPAQADLTPQQQTREQVYERLYGQEQAVSTATAPPVVAQLADSTALISQLQQQIADLQAAVAAKAVPAAPAAEPQKDWFDLLQAGKRTEAEAALQAKVAKEAANTIQQQAVAQALEVSRVEREIEAYNGVVRAENPDLLDVEDFVALKAQQLFMDGYQKAPPKDGKTYTDLYRKSVADAVTQVRTVLQRTRAAAKNEALTTSREVLAASTMAPNDFSVREGQRQAPGQGQPAEPDLSPKSYIEQRKAQSYRNANPMQVS